MALFSWPTLLEIAGVRSHHKSGQRCGICYGLPHLSTMPEKGVCNKKVKAAYFRVYGFGYLQDDWRGPGSATEPNAHFEYGTTFIITIITIIIEFL